MVQNVKITAKYVNSKDNGIADSLSRFQRKQFTELIKEKGTDIDKDTYSRKNLATQQNMDQQRQ